MRSREIIARMIAMQQYQQSSTVLWYVSTGDEVETLFALEPAIASGRRIAVPFCVGESLRCFHLQSIDQLVAGKYGILEPRLDLRVDPQRIITAQQLDLVITPGLAFDRRGGRIGHGKGYYDRLLAQCRVDSLFVGLAYDCQILDQVPMADHDKLMDAIVTPTTIFRRK